MSVRIVFLNEPPLLVEEMLSLFTNYADIEVGQIRYDEEKKRVEIPLRRKVVDFEKTFFGRRTKYHQGEVRSVLRIEHVERLDFKKIENALEKMGGLVTVLFGPKIDERKIYVSSAEEERGKPIVEITMYISRVDIELVDL